MSANYPLSYSDPSREPDFWSEVPATTSPALAPAAHTGGRRKANDPIDRLRRLLRGRAALAVTVAIGGGLLGAALGWWSQSPVYQANGFVNIPPVHEGFTRDDSIPQYRQFMHTEATRLEGLEMALEAVNHPEWVKVSGENTPARVFASSVNAVHTDNDNLLRVSFDHEDAKTAVAGVTAAIMTYKADFEAKQREATQRRMYTYDERISHLQRAKEEADAEIGKITTLYGGLEDLDEQLRAFNAEREALQRELRQIDIELGNALAAKEHARINPEELTVEDLALEDPQLERLLLERSARVGQLNEYVARGMGPKSSTFQQLASLIETTNNQISARAEIVRERYFGTVPNVTNSAIAGPVIPVTQNYIDRLQARQTLAQTNIKGLEAKISEVSSDYDKLVELQTRLARTRDELQALAARRDSEEANIAYRGELGQITTYVPPEGSARVSKDKRPAMALGGGILGFGIPLGLVLLAGLMDSRFRYSEDAAEASEKVTLLGILPNLPDRLSDPNQASIAAHCVHQIRTMLQINHGSDESRAFAVTSAQRGDGKTSLALALGLSYAASGARTLLIDTDLQHGGLSSRLGVNSDEGIMDTLTGGELLRFVCETDVEDLAILPIGRAAANHAGAFSPAAVRHLLDQAKRHFDVIVCDTGPILGSIESTPIASAVDGVLLTVSRGQSRPLVTKALSHLDSVGATVSGLVFNRAQASDFERSVSGMNLRNGVSRLPSRNGAGNGTVLSQN